MKPSTVHAAQPANHSHAVLRIFSRMRDVDRTGKRENGSGAGEGLQLSTRQLWVEQVESASYGNDSDWGCESAATDA